MNKKDRIGKIYIFEYRDTVEYYKIIQWTDKIDPPIVDIETGQEVEFKNAWKVVSWDRDKKQWDNGCHHVADWALEEYGRELKPLEILILLGETNEG